MNQDGIQRVPSQRGTRYRVRVELPPDADGKRRWVSQTFATLRAAQRWRTEQMAAKYGGTLDCDAGTRLRDYLTERWIPHYTRHHRASSLAVRQSHLNTHIVPQLGHLPLRQLTPLVVQRFVDQLDRHPNTVRNIVSTLSAALTDAAKWGLIARNPCQRVTLPAAVRRKPTVWTPAQVQAFLAASLTEDDRALWALLAVTGARISELLALVWADLDFDAGTLHIQRTRTQGAEGWTDGPPKNRHGDRVLYLPQPMLDLLREQQRRQRERAILAKAHFARRPRIFDNGLGHPIPYSTVQHRWKRTCERAGVPAYRRHDLRHANATMQLEAGVPMKLVSEMLGHGSIMVTADVYSHVREVAGRAAAEALGASLLTSPEPTPEAP